MTNQYRFPKTEKNSKYYFILYYQNSTIFQISIRSGRTFQYKTGKET